VTNAGVNSLTDTVSFTWSIQGDKVITATVSNSLGTTSATRTIDIAQPDIDFEIYLPIILRNH